MTGSAAGSIHARARVRGLSAGARRARPGARGEGGSSHYRYDLRDFFPDFADFLRASIRRRLFTNAQWSSQASLRRQYFKEVAPGSRQSRRPRLRFPCCLGLVWYSSTMLHSHYLGSIGICLASLALISGMTSCSIQSDTKSPPEPAKAPAEAKERPKTSADWEPLPGPPPPPHIPPGHKHPPAPR